MPIRQCLQFIGDGYRKIRSDIWIEIALRDDGKNLIISDGRYFNEAKAIKEKNGMMFLIYRPGFLNDDPNPSESQVRPLLEWACKNLAEGPIKKTEDAPPELAYFDYFVINNGSVEDFQKKIRNEVVPFILSSKFYDGI